MLLGARQFFEKRGKSAPTARDYVQNGLIAMWDGVENAGWGTHDQNATTWVDLISGSYSQLANPLWGDNCFYVSRTPLTRSAFLLSQSASNAIKSNAFTFQITSQNFTGASMFVCLWGFKDSSNVFAIQTREWVRSFFSTSIGYYDLLNETVGAFSFLRNGSEYVRYIGETKGGQKSTGDYVPSGDVTVCIGGLTDLYQNTGADINCVRIYSRALTAAEIADNYAIDKARFSLP